MSVPNRSCFGLVTQHVISEVTLVTCHVVAFDACLSVDLRGAINEEGPSSALLMVEHLHAMGEYQIQVPCPCLLLCQSMFHSLKRVSQPNLLHRFDIYDCPKPMSTAPDAVLETANPQAIPSARALIVARRQLVARGAAGSWRGSSCPCSTRHREDSSSLIIGSYIIYPDQTLHGTGLYMPTPTPIPTQLIGTNASPMIYVVSIHISSISHT